jgi:hypothetical protein
MLKHLPRRLGVPLAAALRAACAGNGQGLDSNGQPSAPGNTPDKPLTAEFQSIQDNIFTPICVLPQRGRTPYRGSDEACTLPSHAADAGRHSWS